MIKILWYLLAVNLIGAAVTAYDKYCAVSGRWRVPERTLFLLCIVGGCPGVYLTMKAVRHKTKHMRFMIGIPVIFAVQLVIGVYVYYRFFR